jgi:hypothetical protein
MSRAMQMKTRKNEFLYFSGTHKKRELEPPNSLRITYTTYVLELSFTLQDNFDVK